MKTKLIALLLCFLSLAAHAQGSTQALRGVPSCGAWLRPDSAIAGVANKAWLIGYMSGFNVAMWLMDGTNNAPSNNFFSTGVENSQIFVWMDNYCQKTPLKSLDDGAANLFRELRAK